MKAQVGEAAPDFRLRNQFGADVSLSAFRGRSAVALVFYPLAFSGICTTELCQLRDNLGMFADARVTVFGVSVDSVATLRAFHDAHGTDFDLLADFWPHGQVADRYGAFRAQHGVASRTTVLIDDTGMVRARFMTAPGEARPLERYREAVASL